MLPERFAVNAPIAHMLFGAGTAAPTAEEAQRLRAPEGFGIGQLATPHSQRSVARMSVEVLPGNCLWFEDLIDACRRAVPTETQVMVKREDEQAFAELNAANPIPSVIRKSPRGPNRACAVSEAGVCVAASPPCPSVFRYTQFTAP